MKRQLYEKEGFAEKIDKRHLFINGLNYQLAYHSLNNDELSDNLGLGGDLIPINSEELGVGGNLVTEEEFSIDKTYKVIPEEYSKKINTKLPGTFYTNSIGKVYYEHDKPLNIDDEKKELTCPSPLPDYDFQLINGKGTIVKWNGTELHLVIPEYFLLEVDGKEQCIPVEVIGTGAFQNGNLGSIKIPNTVEKIEDDAFADNDLEYVDIPSGVEDIGNGAFENNDIPKVDIPHSVGSIGDNAFAGNNTKPTINNKPENVIIGNNAFDGNEPTYKNPTPGDVGVVFDPDTGTIIAGEGNGAITIPEELEVGGELYPVTKIEKGAYQGEGLISVKLPSTLERIEDYAFAGNQLIGIEIPHSVVYIGHYAFAFNEKVHSSNGDTKGTIGFIKIYDQEQFHKLNDNGDIEENGTKVLSISNASGKTVELKDYIFVTSSSKYVIDDDFVGDNENPEPTPEPEPDPEPTPEPEPELDPNAKYTQEQIDELISQGYIPVSTAAELQAIGNSPKSSAENYIQIKDIDLTGITWKIIGNSPSPFTGVYNGGNYTITGLTSSGGQYNGLFGIIENAQIENVVLKNANITGYHYAGSLIAKATNSIVKNSHSTGLTVESTGNYVGGLIGMAINTDISNSHVESVHIKGASYVGGIAGKMTGEVTKSYTEGSVEGTRNSVGGLVGEIGEGLISNSYSKSNVKGDYNPAAGVGGLVGHTLENISINNSYSVGLVYGDSSKKGGLVGIRNYLSGTATNSFYDKETSGEVGSTINSQLGTPRTTSEMKNQANYQGWDFTKTWEITSGNYPTLR